MRTMAADSLERAIANRLPSGDHANPSIRFPSVKCVIGRGVPPSIGWMMML